jgi:hypothetical protein
MIPTDENGAHVASVTPQGTAGRMNRQQRADRVVQSAPQSVQKTLREAFSGAASPRKAIKAMCLTCLGFDRQEIKNCSAHACPLWTYRPFQDEGVSGAS